MRLAYWHRPGDGMGHDVLHWTVMAISALSASVYPVWPDVLTGHDAMASLHHVFDFLVIARHLDHACDVMCCYSIIFWCYNYNMMQIHSISNTVFHSLIHSLIHIT